MDVSALDENGKPVDWWFIYKVPKLTKSAGADSATGYEYVYFDANSTKVDKSPYTLDSKKGALHKTLDAVISGTPASVGYVIYNDERPAPTSIRDDAHLGHTKGIIAFDTTTNTGFWLLHSWPKYAAPQALNMPTPIYGQTFLCVSLDLATADAIAAIMPTHQEPQVFAPRKATPASTQGLLSVMDKFPDNQQPSSIVLDCVTRGIGPAGGAGTPMPFKVMAKNREWDNDFWNNLVAKELKLDMDVETWIRGEIPPVVDSDGIHKTFDIKYINLGPLGLHFAWPETQDHAKWAITTTDDWVCIGDINRMISQRKRGGGCIAFQNRTLWTALSKTDLLLAPPGHDRDEARTLVQSTHAPPVSSPPMPPSLKMTVSAQAAAAPQVPPVSGNGATKAAKTPKSTKKPPKKP